MSADTTNDRPLGEFTPNMKPYIPIYGLIAIFLTVFTLMFVGIGLFAAMAFLADAQMVSPTVAVLLPVVVSVTLALLVFLATMYYLYKVGGTMTYRVYSDRVETEGGLFSTKHKTLQLSDVTDVKYSQGMLASRYGVGTIKFSTAGSDGSSISFSGVENAEPLYRDIEQLIDENNDRGDEDASGTTGGAQFDPQYSVLNA